MLEGGGGNSFQENRSSNCRVIVRYIEDYMFVVCYCTVSEEKPGRVRRFVCHNTFHHIKSLFHTFCQAGWAMSSRPFLAHDVFHE